MWVREEAKSPSQRTKKEHAAIENENWEEKRPTTNNNQHQRWHEAEKIPPLSSYDYYLTTSCKMADQKSVLVLSPRSSSWVVLRHTWHHSHLRYFFAHSRASSSAAKIEYLLWFDRRCYLLLLRSSEEIREKDQLIIYNFAPANQKSCSKKTSGMVLSLRPRRFRSFSVAIDLATVPPSPNKTVLSRTGMKPFLQLHGLKRRSLKRRRRSKIPRAVVLYLLPGEPLPSSIWLFQSPWNSWSATSWFGLVEFKHSFARSTTMRRALLPIARVVLSRAHPQSNQVLPPARRRNGNLTLRSTLVSPQREPGTTVKSSSSPKRSSKQGNIISHTLLSSVHPIFLLEESIISALYIIFRVFPPEKIHRSVHTYLQQMIWRIIWPWSYPTTYTFGSVRLSFDCTYMLFRKRKLGAWLDRSKKMIRLRPFMQSHRSRTQRWLAFHSPSEHRTNYNVSPLW